MISVNGIDISERDTILNWSEYKYDFAFITATEGDNVDRIFRLQWKEAKGKTIRGPIHIFHPATDTKKAAKYLADTLDGDLGELPLAIYLHKTDGRGDVMARLVEFINEYKQHTKSQTAIIYTSLDFLNLVQAERFPFIGTYPLWLISYPFVNYDNATREHKIKEVMTGRLMLAFPPPPRPFPRVVFWRWTNKAPGDLISGYPPERKKDVNLSMYNGEHVSKLFAEFSIITTPKAIEIEQEIYRGRVSRETSVRSGPYESYMEMGKLPAGTLIESDQMQKDPIKRKWLRIVKAENTEGGAILLKATGKQISESPSWILASDVEDRPKEKEIEQVIVKFKDGSRMKAP